MASPETPDDDSLDATYSGHVPLDATVDSPSSDRPPTVAQSCPVELPVYRPRARSVVWSFVAAFILAAAMFAAFTWLLLR